MDYFCGMCRLQSPCSKGLQTILFIAKIWRESWLLERKKQVKFFQFQNCPSAFFSLLVVILKDNCQVSILSFQQSFKGECLSLLDTKRRGGSSAVYLLVWTKVYFAHSWAALFSFLLEIDNLGHFLFLHDFPMLDDTIVHFFFKPLVNLSALQPDLILGIFFDFSWAITFQMFDATAEATAPTFRIKPFGIVRTRLGQVSNLTTYKTLRKSERKKTSFQFHTEFLPNRNSFPPKRVF